MGNSHRSSTNRKRVLKQQTAGRSIRNLTALQLESLKARLYSRLVKGPTPDHQKRLGACRLWIGGLSQGYGVIGAGGEHGGALLVHRAVWELEVGPIPEGLHVCHKCDVRNCTRISHLFLGTAKDNMQDAKAKGRTTFGLKHHNVGLTERQVIQIRKLWEMGGFTQTEIARLFDTNKANVSQIVRGKRWQHLLPKGWKPPRYNRWSRAE